MYLMRTRQPHRSTGRTPTRWRRIRSDENPHPRTARTLGRSERRATGSKLNIRTVEQHLCRIARSSSFYRGDGAIAFLQRVFVLLRPQQQSCPRVAWLSA